MTEPRSKFVDYDARPQPKTDRWCCKCQKDLREGQKHRYIYLDDQMCAIHPEDLPARGALSSDFGWNLIGSDCARKVGMEFSADLPFDAGASTRE